MLTLLTLLACTPSTDPLADLDHRYTSIAINRNVADRDTTRNIHNKEARRRKVQAEKDRVAFFKDPKVQAAIDAARADAVGTLAHTKGEAYWQQALEARSWTAEEKAKENDILGRLEEAAAQESTWYSPDGRVRIVLEGSWNEVSKDADTLDDAARQSLAESYIEHRSRVIGADLQELVRLRNEVARREGFPSYWELALASQGLTPEEVTRITGELSDVVRDIHSLNQAEIRKAAESMGITDSWANHPMLRRKANLDAGKDLAEPYFDATHAEDRVLTALQDLGIPTDGWQVYTGSSRQVRSGVYGFAIRPPEHVAIVMSEQDRRYYIWPYEALAHEGGHAVWWKALGPESVASPVLWEPPTPWFEGFAQFFERLVFEPAFLSRYMPELPEAARKGLYQWRGYNVAEQITSSIVEVEVERLLYKDPSDLAAIARAAASTRARLTGAPMPPESAGQVYDPALLSSLLWNYPAYSQNYLFAYLTEAWLYAGVKKAVGEPVGNPKVGPYLQENLVRAPATTPFPDRLSAFAGTDRSTPLRDYLRDSTGIVAIP